MKKILLGLLILLATGCSTVYNLEYKDDVFHEEIKITSVVEDDSESNFEDYNFEIEDGKKYNNKIERKNNTETLILTYSYDDLSFGKSEIFSCFEHQRFEETEDYYSIYLWGNPTGCLFISDIKVTFKTDYPVIETNATSINSKEGIYKWDKLDDGFKIQLSKNLPKTNYNFIWIRIGILIAAVGIGYTIFVYTKKKVHE